METVFFRFLPGHIAIHPPIILIAYSFYAVRYNIPPFRGYFVCSVSIRGAPGHALPERVRKKGRLEGVSPPALELE